MSRGVIVGENSSSVFRMTKIPVPIVCTAVADSITAPAIFEDKTNPSNWTVGGSAVWTGAAYEFAYNDTLSLVPGSWYDPDKTYRVQITVTDSGIQLGVRRATINVQTVSLTFPICDFVPVVGFDELYFSYSNYSSPVITKIEVKDITLEAPK